MSIEEHALSGRFRAQKDLLGTLKESDPRQSRDRLKTVLRWLPIVF